MVKPFDPPSPRIHYKSFHIRVPDKKHNFPELAISVRNLSKSYGSGKSPAEHLLGPLASLPSRVLRKTIPEPSIFHALKDISFDLPKGRSLGVIGLNGSGKSTLLQIIASTLTPTSGEIKKSGRLAALLELGSGFNHEFTGRENARLNANLLGLSMKEIDHCMNDILAFADIGDFIDQPVRTYSSGMVVRLAFAIIAHVNPEILLVDEALAVGDAYFQAKCLRFMRNFTERGGTLLLVSHDPSAHIALCSEVIMLHEGQIIRSGDAKTVLDYYNAFIAKETDKPNISQKRNKDGNASHRSGSLDLTFNDIVLENSKGDECEKFTTGENCIIKSHLISRKDIEAATIGILIRDLFGRDVYATNTKLQGLKSLTMETGEHRSLEIKLKLDIGPGRYTITVAAHKGKVHTEGNYDWIDDCLIIDILPPVPMKFSGIALMNVDFKY